MDENAGCRYADKRILLWIVKPSIVFIAAAPYIAHQSQGE
jgi:hypothetical protein